jgi:exodeoxyribonuclease VII large subunit
MAKKQVKIYTVSQVNTMIKTALEDSLPSSMLVSGEISGWKVHGSGHCYFTLKDESSQMQSVMWSSSFSKVKFEPENGMAVIAKGYIDLYPPQGKLQFYVEKLEPAGVGALQLAFEQLVAKLAAEGLFDQEHKKTLPRFPQRIGILTSESGAAVGDIVDSIYNRWPAVSLFLYPVPVQGEGAGEKIAQAIENVNRFNDKYGLDLLIVGRGGGSLEDLWAFNEEVVARAIFASKIPVISAVGHEYDTTIADFVADARASTPTKAGVIAVPDSEEILAQLKQYESRLGYYADSKMKMAAANLREVEASSVFRNPRLIVDIAIQRLDDIQTGIGTGLRVLVENLKSRLEQFREKVSVLNPQVQINTMQIQLMHIVSALPIGIERKLKDSKVQIGQYERDILVGFKKSVSDAQLSLASVESRLSALNPKAVLKRGYSITTNKSTGKLVKSKKDVQKGDIILTELGDSSLLESIVESKKG